MLSAGSRSSEFSYLLQAGLQAKNIPGHRDCRQWHHQPKKVPWQGQNQVRDCASTRTKRPFHAALTLFSRSDDAPHAGAVVTPLSRCNDAPLTLLTRSGDAPAAPHTPLPRVLSRCDAHHTALGSSNDAASAPCWRPSHAAMTPLPRP